MIEMQIPRGLDAAWRGAAYRTILARPLYDATHCTARVGCLRVKISRERALYDIVRHRDVTTTRTSRESRDQLLRGAPISPANKKDLLSTSLLYSRTFRVNKDVSRYPHRFAHSFRFSRPTVSPQIRGKKKKQLMAAFDVDCARCLLSIPSSLRTTNVW